MFLLKHKKYPSGFAKKFTGRTLKEDILGNYSHRDQYSLRNTSIASNRSEAIRKGWTQ